MGFSDSQHALGGVQKPHASFQRLRAALLLGVLLQREPHLVQCDCELVADDVQRIGKDISHASATAAAKIQSAQAVF